MTDGIYYFVPGQVILHLEHDDIGEAALETAVDQFLLDAGGPWSLLTREVGHTITFPLIRSDEGRYISMVLTRSPVPKPEDYEKDVRASEEGLIALLAQLYNLLGPGIVLSHAPHIFLRTLTANSLMSAGPHQPGLGGPGAWPTPATPPAGNQGTFSNSSIQGLADMEGAVDGEKVAVAILDTTPVTKEFMKSKIESVALDWPPQSDLLRKHKLYQDLRMKMSIVPYKYAWRDFCFSLKGHGYLMSDHGLFVAGIIHTIAKNSPLTLYEVLNPYGAGSYESVYFGLANALKDFENRNHRVVEKLIINLSLVLDLPLVLNLPTLGRRANKYRYMHYDPGITNPRDTQLKIRCIDSMSMSIREILRKIAGLQDVLVVAAAGNDRVGGKRPWARYPAACQGVIGAGALPKIDPSGGIYARPATYSNICDLPPGDGYMTLGGEYGADLGIRGVFTHDIPVYPGPGNLPDYSHVAYNPNPNGWAWWAGTSFSTAIISGLLALGWSNNWGANIHNVPGVPPTTLADKAHNFLNRASSNRRTTDGERVIDIHQT